MWEGEIGRLLFFTNLSFTHLRTYSNNNSPNPYRVAQTMRRHTPRVEYFICSPSGRLYVAPPATSDPFAGKGYPLLTDEAALLGAHTDSGGIPEDFLACNTSLNGAAVEGLVRAYSPSSLIQFHFNGRPVETVAVGQLGLSKVGLGGDKSKPLVVGISVKGK